MTRHAVETCPDDLEALRERLDELSRGGSRVLAVTWQSSSVVDDQGAALQGRGSFVIVSQRDAGQGDEMTSLDVEPQHDGP